MPAGTLDTGDPPLWLAAHQVGGQLALLAQFDERQARIQQCSKHRFTVTRHQGTDWHGPLACLSGAILPFQQATIALPMYIRRFSQYPYRAGEGHRLLSGVFTAPHQHQSTEPISPDLEPLREHFPLDGLAIAHRMKRSHFDLQGGLVLLASIFMGERGRYSAGAHDGLLGCGQPMGLVIVVPVASNRRQGHLPIHCGSGLFSLGLAGIALGVGVIVATEQDLGLGVLAASNRGNCRQVAAIHRTIDRRPGSQVNRQTSGITLDNGNQLSTLDTVEGPGFLPARQVTFVAMGVDQLNVHQGPGLIPQRHHQSTGLKDQLAHGEDVSGQRHSEAQ
ncbi:hypothetical protein D3C77_218110 [compost metagenome]